MCNPSQCIVTKNNRDSVQKLMKDGFISELLYDTELV